MKEKEIKLINYSETKIKFSELTEREKQIYEAGHGDGGNLSIKILLGGLGFIVLVYVISALLINHK